MVDSGRNITHIPVIDERKQYLPKVCFSKDSASARKAVIGMLVGVVFIEFVMCAIAVVGYAIYAKDPRFFLADGSINRAMSEEIILRIGFEQVPVLVGSMLFAAGWPSYSTGNTFLMVTSTNLTNDILKPYFLKSTDSKR